MGNGAFSKTSLAASCIKRLPSDGLVFQKYAYLDIQGTRMKKGWSLGESGFMFYLRCFTQKILSIILSFRITVALGPIYLLSSGNWKLSLILSFSCLMHWYLFVSLLIERNVIHILICYYSSSFFRPITT